MKPFKPENYNCTQEDLNKFWKQEDLDASVVREGIILATWHLLKMFPGRNINHLTSAEVRVIRIINIITDGEKYRIYD